MSSYPDERFDEQKLPPPRAARRVPLVLLLLLAIALGAAVATATSYTLRLINF